MRRALWHRKGLEKSRAEVPLAGVREYDDDGLPAFSGRLAMRTAAATAAPLEMRRGSFFARQAPGVLDRLLVGDLLDRIHQRKIKDVRHKSGADPLDLVRPGLQRLTFLALREHGTRRRSTATETIGFP